MTLRVFDTDHISLLQRSHPQVTQRFDAHRDKIAVTVISIEEQLRGRLNVIRRISNPQKLIQAYTALLYTVGYFNTFEILRFDEEACARYIKLVKKRIRIGRQDLKIAAIARSANAILVTRNHRDFATIPNLSL